MISMHVIKSGSEILLAACDKKLLGKILKDGELKLHIKKDFYYEMYVDRGTFVNAMKMATIANLVGEEVVAIAIEEGYVNKDNVIYLKNVPYAQFVKMI